MATLEEQLSDVRKDIADKKREIETAKAKLADHPEQQRMVELDQQLLLQMQEKENMLLKERAASQLFGGYHAVVIQLVFWGVLLGVLFHKYLPRTPDGGMDLGWLATIIPFFLLVPEKVINDFRGKGVASWVVVSVWQRLRRQSAVEVAQEGAQQGAQEGAQQGAQEGAQQGAQEGVHGGDAEQGAQSVAQSGNSVATSNELL